jgi:hypothetical protein
VLFNRIGYAYEPGQLTKVVERDRLLFEFDGAFRPMSLLPLMLPRMRAWPRRESTRQWLEANDRFRRDVLARLRADGPLLAIEIDDTAQVSRAPDGWSGSNQVPIMLDLLSRQGAVAILGREGRHRRWDLAERVYPSVLPEFDPEEAAQQLAERRLQAAGIAKQKSPWSGVGTAGPRRDLRTRAVAGCRGRRGAPRALTPPAARIASDPRTDDGITVVHVSADPEDTGLRTCCRVAIPSFVPIRGVLECRPERMASRPLRP